MKIVARVPDSQVMSDLDAAAAYAKATGSGDTRRLGVTGFCWGGRIVWLYAAHNASLDAGVAWYGRLVPNEQQPRNALQPEHPIDVVDRLKAPVLGLYGGKDQGIPLDTVEQMRAALRNSKSKAARSSEIVVYDDAGHGFHADYRPSYDRKAATDGRQRLQSWFRKHKAA